MKPDSVLMLKIMTELEGLAPGRVLQFHDGTRESFRQLLSALAVNPQDTESIRADEHEFYTARYLVECGYAIAADGPARPYNSTMYGSETDLDLVRLTPEGHRHLAIVKETIQHENKDFGFRT